MIKLSDIFFLLLEKLWKGHLKYVASVKIGLKDTKMKNKSRWFYVIIQNIFPCKEWNYLSNAKKQTCLSYTYIHL